MRKTQNKSTGSSKNGEYHILGQNSDFRKKSGILELEMFIPVQDYIGLYVTKYKTIQDYIGLYRTIQDYTRLYRTI